jgi:hypothetical protein
MIPTTGEIFPAAFQGTRTAPLLWRAVRSLSRVFLHGPPGYWRCAPYIQRSKRASSKISSRTMVSSHLFAQQRQLAVRPVIPQIHRRNDYSLS